MYETTQRPTLEATPRSVDMRAPARSKKSIREQTHAPIVPSGAVTGRSLTLVISIMCFLACLTAGAVYMINQSADAWMRDVASEITVQVDAKEGQDTSKVVQRVADLLQSQPGIADVDILSSAESSKLLQPWLGSIEGIGDLPVPRLIAIELDRGATPNLDSIRSTLSKQFTGVTLDDHRQWQKQIRTVTRSFALGGIAILSLVGIATILIIVTATRSAMTSNREIVEVLHFVGATDRFIAREFEKNFLRLGIRAGIIGAVCAMVVFLLLPIATELLGGGSLTTVELNRFIGSGSLDLMGYAFLGLVIIVVAALCMLTSRFGVYGILNSRD
ncbi:MAG: ABC transporter permease [Alphaproteobacteria bacterium]|nr:ABC transporter permease [Alphaproteobacteria bacterium]